MRLALRHATGELPLLCRVILPFVLSLLTFVSIAEVAPAIASLAELTRSHVSGANRIERFILEGDVWWARPAEGRLVLRDDSAAVELLVDCDRGFPRRGQRVRLTGRGPVRRCGAAWQLGVMGALISNDGIHALVEKSDLTYLEAGFHPIRLQ